MTGLFQEESLVIDVLNVRFGSTSDLRQEVNWLATLVKLFGEPGQLSWQ